MAEIKIAKYLAQCGIASRRKAEILIKQGQVSVNSKIMTNSALRVNPDIDKITYLGKPIKPQKNVYYLLNKPLGYTSTCKDPHAEKLAVNLVPKNPPVWPIGRLDKYTSGLLILTNDGNLTQKLTHPRFSIKKEYLLTTNLPLTNRQIQKIRQGIKLDDGFIKPDVFEKIGQKSYRIVLHEGRKRIVRRIIESTGKKISSLMRNRFAFLELGNLKSGHWRYLTKEEISQLTKI